MNYPYLLGVENAGEHRDHTTLFAFYNAYRKFQIELQPLLRYNHPVTSALTSIFGLVPRVIIEARLRDKQKKRDGETAIQTWD